jgi:putative ABC transport system permease protein
VVLYGTSPTLFFLISREFVLLLTLANVIAWPIAFFLMAGAMAYFIALLTVSFQAFKAARTDPARSLRYE